MGTGKRILGPTGWRRWWWGFLLGLAAVAVGWAGEGDTLAQLRAELIPQAGAETAYGIPLSWDNAQTFADWFYEIQLAPEQAVVVEEALKTIPAPCCDDNSVFSCCCTKNGRICNLTRSARGLAQWLVSQRGYGVEEVRAAVEEWLRFLKPDYYLARALESQGLDPADHGLAAHEAYESCYQGQCEAPLDAGGCGGMGLKVILEKAEPDCCQGEG